MAAGFLSPGLLFFGAVDKSERDFCVPVFRGLRERGYTRFVEVCSGALVVTITAMEAGWTPDQIEASDVTLFSSVVGLMASDQDINQLEVKVDGEPLELTGSPTHQAAAVLYEELLARIQVKDDIQYWNSLAEDLITRREIHLEEFEVKLAKFGNRLSGIHYRPMDLWDHLAEVAEDPHTVVSANPPSYDSGYEKLYDTGGRVTWKEPTYKTFDPETGYSELREYMADKPALIINLEEHQAAGSKDKPLYVRPMSNGKRAYLLSNRPEEIWKINGGPKVAPRNRTTLGLENKRPIIPLGYEISPDSTVEMYPVRSVEADYYRELWMHKFRTNGGNMNLLCTVDGYAAGIIGYSLDPITRPMSMKSSHITHAMLRFAFGAPHHTYRLTRLVSMLSLRKEELELFRMPSNSMYMEVATGLVTNERTKYPEAKGQRGIMKLVGKKEVDGMNNLLYQADWITEPDRKTVLRQWLKKEAQWRKNSTKLSK